MRTTPLRTIVVATFILIGFAGAAWAQTRTSKWEVEFRGGAAAPSNPSGGATKLPEAVPDMTLQDRHVQRIQSWFFGAGPVYLEGVRPPSIPALVTADGVLTQAFARRPTGPTFGGRVSRAIDSRFAVSVDVEYGLSSLEMPRELVSALERSTNAFSATWNAFFRTPLFATQIGSTSSVQSKGGRELTTTGSVTFAPWPQRRLSPHFIGGGGFITRLGDTPGGTLEGSLLIAPTSLAGDAIRQTDTVVFRASVPRYVPAAVVGGGVTYDLRRDIGIRFEMRDLIAPNRFTTLVTTTPTNVTSPTPTIILTILGTGGMPVVFSNLAPVRPTLSESVADFKTYEASGLRHTLQTTVGLVWRF